MEEEEENFTKNWAHPVNIYKSRVRDLVLLKYIKYMKEAASECHNHIIMK
jgi:hypothetical protein